MIKHSLVECLLVAFLVGVMLYCISPGEVEIAYDGLTRKLSDAIGESLVRLHLRPPPVPDEASPPTPGPRPGKALGTIWEWLPYPEVLAFSLAAGGILWMGRSKHRRQFRADAERKMAVNLTRGLRRMDDV